MKKIKRLPEIKIDLGSKNIEELRKSKITILQFKKKYNIDKILKTNGNR